MAEAVALFVAKKLGDALLTEGIDRFKSLITTLTEVHDQMHNIQSRLNIIQAYLKYADERIDDDIVLASWVQEVRKLAFRIEYLVDRYTYIMMEPERKDGFWTFNGIRSVMTKKSLKHIADELKNCYTRLDNITKDKTTFDVKVAIPAGESSNNKALIESQKVAESALSIRDEDIVGFEDEKAKLIEWLKDDKASETRVISVWGMGGVGKTTLVTSVYNSSLIGHFDCRAWIYVSQRYKRVDLLKTIIRKLYRERKSDNTKCKQDPTLHFEVDDDDDYTDLLRILGQLLMNKRYLIILDDVWETIVWDDLKNVLDEKKMMSTVIITTRDQEVARDAASHENHILELKPLDEKEARALFDHHVFRKQESKDCPRFLEDWAEKIVRKCGGLPLAIVWIANYLARKKLVEINWKTVYVILLRPGEKGEDKLTDRIDIILSLSISNLSYCLRSCFLYCCVFPEEYEIKRKRLLRLWVSEGFVESGSEERTEMEIAEDYLNKLISHSMFIVIEKNVHGRVKTLRIHDFVRKMILKKQQSESFYEIWDRNMQRTQVRDNVRCLSINIDMEENDNNIKHRYTHLRTLHFFSKSASYIPMSKFKLLRVLNLKDTRIQGLPKEIDILYNLRYLNIRETKVKELPKCIYKLQNLETLDIWHSSIRNMPEGISKLNKLQHLIGDKIKGNDIELISKLKHLQTLRAVSFTKSNTVQPLGSLSKLRVLEIYIDDEQGIPLLTCVSGMEHLLNLTIKMNVLSSDFLQLDDDVGLTELPCGLEKLCLLGSLYNGVLPEFLVTPINPKLVSLTLFVPGLKEDPIPMLTTSSPNLRYLSFRGDFKEKVEQLCFPKGSFGELRTMIIETSVEVMEINDDSLKCLEKMEIRKCLEMNALPIGVENLVNLKELFLYKVPDEFTNKVHEKRSTYLQHIAFIRRRYKDNGAYIEEML